MINLYSDGVYIFNNIRKFAKADITFEVFVLIANTVYLRQ